MSVREFELFHGAVLTKLVRTEKPLTLRMIETRSADAWSTYRINDELSLVIKHSVKSRSLKGESAKAWQFVFSPEQMRQVAESGTWAALVCGASTATDAAMEVCLLEPSELSELLDLRSSGQQSLMVKRIEGKSLRVSSSRRLEMVIPRNRLDKWEVPGS